MKKSKKLMILGLSLATGAVAATSTVSSFAWFSMNTKVTVSSMAVQATASKNLLISSAEKGTYLASLALQTSNDKMVPVSTAVKATPAFYKLDHVGSQMEADKSDRKNSTFKVASPTDYVKEEMWIKSTGMDASNLKANVTFTGGDADLDPALRVMFVVTGTSPYLMAPTAKSTPSYKAIDSLTYVAATGTAVDGTYYYKDADGAELDKQPDVGADVSTYFTQVVNETTANVTVTTNNSVILTSMDADDAIKIEVYIWYEGQDAACKSTNAVTLRSTVFSIEYTVE